MVCKVTTLIRRKEGISEEEFHHYWSGPHARVILAHPLAKEKIIEYSQYHTQKTELAKIQGLPAAAVGDEWDGMVTITVEKIEDFNEMHAHPYYAEFITPDELRFGDPAKVLVMVGYDEPKIVDRKVVRGVTA
ncbi:hypothetical protein, variant [Exophiala oligosperma]|uniref:EthD domain-containing protein n=1 Tax=Exophiala oligosperma TaxID=215243 RepID=A0A0D2DM98_9EURO|nr:uncharacterized protein PV06_05107 [Exophiala oligosperma]XP_016264284.1 hypothetical protein, variant [Exophiala oligosperma]KIW44067.1 hypothetical protein PV06_05107 [Exophiala oligosperma]KIW44068.1 hypothetical protein, variant [Exophiala oligosperma]